MSRRTLIAGAAGLAGMFAASRRAQAFLRDPAWPRSLTMGTASPGGTYAVYGPAWGTLVERATGIAIAYRATQGARQNIMLTDRGETDLAMTTLGAAREAWLGAGGWTGGATFRDIRALFPMYDTPFHGIALRRLGIAFIRQLAGRSVGIGARDAVGNAYLPLLLSRMDVRNMRIRLGGIDALVRQVLDGSLDACLVATGAPVPAFTRAAQQASLHFLGFPAVAAASLPELQATAIPRGTYRGQTHELRTVGMPNFAICRSGLPADLAYDTVAAVFLHGARLRISPQAVRADRVLPLHPGAARYFREHGIAAPTLAG